MLRRRPPSHTSPPPPAQLPPLEDENLLWEILLRLPPLPSSLPRASLVCKRWLGVVSDHGFLRNLRAHHKKPPLLGFFFAPDRGLEFVPTLDPPDRIPAARFYLPEILGKQRWTFYDCRHGLCLGLLEDLEPREAVVWDPITGHQRQIAIPPEFIRKEGMVLQNGAVLCAAGHGRVHGHFSLSPFKVVFLYVDSFVTTVSASLYESESGAWGNIVSKTMLAAYGFITRSILAGSTLGWLSQVGTILEFDIENQRLGVIETPENHEHTRWSCFQLLRTQEIRLGLAVLTGSMIEIWVRKDTSDGTARLMLQKTLELHKLLPGSSIYMEWTCCINRFDEDTNAIILSIGADDIFMVNIESLLVRKVASSFVTGHPYRNFYNAVGSHHATKGMISGRETSEDYHGQATGGGRT